MSAAFFVNCATYVASIITLFFVTVDGKPAPKAQRASLASDFMSGVRYAWNHESTRTFLGLSTVMAFFGRGVLELLPAMADVMFGRGSNGLAALTAAVGAGAIIASTYMSRGRIRHMRRIAAAGVLVALALTVVLSLTSNIVLGLLIVACIGMALSFSGVSLQTLVQSTLDDRYRGRVMSLWSVVVFGGIAAGGLAIGTVAQLTNLTVATFGAGTVGLLISTAIVYYIFASGKTRPIPSTKPKLADAEDPLL